MNDYPEGVDYELQPTEFDGTKTVVLDELLPEVVSIPAIKSVDSTTNKRGEFGTLISEISSVISEEIDREIRDKLSDLDLRQNETVREVENAVSAELGAAFENQSVRFDFPDLSAEYLFDNADIEIDDEQIDSLSKENVGEGVKRTLIFSLVRTLADIREGDLLSDEDEEVEGRPLLLCYEEADLFLHPSLQKQLLQTFEEFADGGDQVLFSTHSPILVQYDPLGTVNIVRKDEDGATTMTQFHDVLPEDESRRSQLTDLQSVSSYVFADEVVLVEGVSDEIVLDKLSRRFGPEDSSFRTSSTPILATGGKGQVSQFYDFLDELGIEAYAVLDIDALYRYDGPATIDSMVPDEELTDLDRLVEFVREREDDVEYSYDRDAIPERVKNKPWSDTYEELEHLLRIVEEGGEVTPDDVQPVDRVLEDQKTPSREKLWVGDDAEPLRVDVVETLLEQNILVLSGDLEDYYPNGGGNKRTEALEFDPNGYSEDELRRQFQELGETTDVERMLNDVLGTK